MREHIDAALAEAADALARLRANDAALDSIACAAGLMVAALQAENRIYSCGNGGSMCDAMHFAEELSGRWRLNRRALGATSISDPSHLSCVANDFGYEQVFSRYVEAMGRSGDVLVAISTSGTSKNILRACEAAKAKGMKIVTLTGRPGSPVGAMADADICTPGGQYADRVQELHIKSIHILIELVERALCPENYR
ncbi:MAG: D-sedoheptulose 7-phosphate isomerase [Betaproteobacteria bacterium]|nr:D-sedoheptulose 7-phosphate isomerase [Betaproteobacteria bacterium]